MITQEAPIQATRTQAHTYSRIALGLSPSTRLLVVGITSGKPAGQPAALSSQSSPYGNNNWQPCYTPLTGPAGLNYLTDLVIAAGGVTDTTSHAVGLGNDGNLYCAGTEANGQWTPGAGVFAQTTNFQSGSLSAQVLNSATVFALTTLGTPYVAAYCNQSSPPAWQPGFALNPADKNAYTQLLARPDLGDAGTTHAIGLNVGGQASEVAVCSGPGVGSTTWSAGHGLLGGAGLPKFSQLLVVSADAAGKLHVIGLGTDGSVWDIDQFTPGITGGTWSATSQQVVPAGTISGSKIDFYLGAGLSLNLVAWSGTTLVAFATYMTSWSSASPVSIPTAGVATEWHIAANCETSKSGTVFVLGAAITGLVYELAYLNTQGVWEAGAQVPINK